MDRDKFHSELGQSRLLMDRDKFHSELGQSDFLWTGISSQSAWTIRLLMDRDKFYSELGQSDYLWTGKSFTVSLDMGMCGILKSIDCRLYFLLKSVLCYK